MNGNKLSMVLSTGAPAFTRRIILRGRISDSQNSLGYFMNRKANHYTVSSIYLVAEILLFSALFADLYLSIMLCQRIATLSGDRFDTATLNPLEAIFRARLLPITLSP